MASMFQDPLEDIDNLNCNWEEMKLLVNPTPNEQLHQFDQQEEHEQMPLFGQLQLQKQEQLLLFDQQQQQHEQEQLLLFGQEQQQQQLQQQEQLPLYGQQQQQEQHHSQFSANLNAWFDVLQKTDVPDVQQDPDNVSYFSSESIGQSQACMVIDPQEIDLRVQSNYDGQVVQYVVVNQPQEEKTNPAVSGGCQDHQPYNYPVDPQVVTDQAADILNADMVDKGIPDIDDTVADVPTKKRRGPKSKCPCPKCKLGLKTEKMGDGKHHCPYIGCPKSFAKPDKLKSHIRTKHEGIKPFLCKFCGAAWPNKYDCKRHEETHREGSGKYKCPIDWCDFTCGRIDHLRSHKTTHLKYEPVKTGKRGRPVKDRSKAGGQYEEGPPAKSRRVQSGKGRKNIKKKSKAQQKLNEE